MAEEEVDLSALVAAVCDQMRVIAVQKEIDLRLEATEGIRIVGSESFLRRLCCNLLSNAIGFSARSSQIHMADETPGLPRSGIR